MANFIDDFMKSMGPQVASEMSKSLGINKNVATQLIPQIAPLILGGLKKQKDEHGGAPRIDHILNKYGSADVLNDIGGLFKNKVKEDPDPKLGGLLGDSGIQAAKMLGNQFNLDSGTAMKLIPMLAPLILGALTQKRDQGGAGSSGIASLLDQDGDGSVLDDVAGFLMKGLGGGGTSKAGANILGSLLGGLFGRRK